MTTQDIPLVDLSIQHEEIAEEVRAGFERVLAAGNFILGQEVDSFEAQFAQFCGVEHVVGVGSGTDALELALRAGGIRSGDEVIAPTNTFVATAEAVVRAGGIIRLVDCDENYLIDPAGVSEALSPRTKAIIGVDLYGQVAPAQSLREVAGPDILLVEDAAQSQGARQQGQRAGGLGDVAGTSFYPGKNLGAYGDGGAVLTNSSTIADRLRRLRNHGGTRRYEHLELGTNSRLDTLQAVVLSAKLSRLDRWNQARRDAAAYYTQLLEEVPDVIAPRTAEGNEHVFHLYVVRVPQRDRVMAMLRDAGIGAAVHYPAPLHRLPAFTHLGIGAGTFPMAERLSAEILSLPIYPGISRAHQDRVVESLSEALAAC
ncbi:DegT/DnrJ/EryC1/StrS family aminotransferase [Parafrigoribacterium mesophilum]|uniref:DegT/DnrJ/EryC1/StrS family aminotransferase n=1 Tax=Parafrigoribacterium mesophilum TaxID=433646 RepID=UPI0031FBE1D1